ncbi:MAG TPA: urease accessory UreF family protein [Burkholderiaceae bacterium]|nr:urease accessory UreF family protein [Burkholderiaceae bacterium]
MNPASLLQLIWLASPALPVGGFSYSEGLEAAVETGLVSSETSVGGWLLDQLELGLARADLPLLASAFEAWKAGDSDRLRSLNDWFLQTRETSELKLQAEQMGRSMLEWLRNQDAADDRLAVLAALPAAPAWPIAFALAAAQSGAPCREALLAFGFAWAENMVQAAIKAVPLGQNAGQRILARLAQALPKIVEEALARQDGERQTLTPMLAILSSQHETQYSRLFRS